MALLSNTRIYGTLEVDNPLSVSSTQESTNTFSGALLISGGAGITGNVNAGAFYSDNYFYSDGTPLLSNILIVQEAYNHANSAYDQANVGILIAQSAYNYANTISVSSSQGFPVVDLGQITEQISSEVDCGLL